MADQEWSKNAIFDPALARRVLEEQIHVERPADIDKARAAAPPVPGQEALERRAVLADPQVVELWRQIAADTPPPDDAATLAQLSMALYLLQAVHDKSGHQHLSQDERRRPNPDEDEGPGAEPVR
jgi:hypothetical protein